MCTRTNGRVLYNFEDETREKESWNEKYANSNSFIAMPLISFDSYFLLKNTQSMKNALEIN